MVHLLGVWINITAVLSAVWEHNTLVWFWTKTPRSNNRGRFVKHPLWCCSVRSGFILCMLNFHCFLRASAASHFHTFLIQRCRSWKRLRERQEVEDRLSVWWASVSLEFDRQLVVVWSTAGNMADVLHCQIRRFTFDGWFLSVFWQFFHSHGGPDPWLFWKDSDHPPIRLPAQWTWTSCHALPCTDTNPLLIPNQSKQRFSSCHASPFCVLNQCILKFWIMLQL